MSTGYAIALKQVAPAVSACMRSQETRRVQYLSSVNDVILTSSFMMVKGICWKCGSWSALGWAAVASTRPRTGVKHMYHWFATEPQEQICMLWLQHPQWCQLSLWLGTRYFSDEVLDCQWSSSHKDCQYSMLQEAKQYSPRNLSCNVRSSFTNTTTTTKSEGQKTLVETSFLPNYSTWWANTASRL